MTMVLEKKTLDFLFTAKVSGDPVREDDWHYKSMPCMSVCLAYYYGYRILPNKGTGHVSKGKSDRLVRKLKF